MEQYISHFYIYSSHFLWSDPGLWYPLQHLSLTKTTHIITHISSYPLQIANSGNLPQVVQIICQNISKVENNIGLYVIGLPCNVKDTLQNVGMKIQVQY
jgi:hypothetical protein